MIFRNVKCKTQNVKVLIVRVQKCLFFLFKNLKTNKIRNVSRSLALYKFTFYIFNNFLPYINF